MQTSTTMASDDDSFQPSSSSEEGSSYERESQTLDELQKAMVADAEEESADESESSGKSSAASSLQIHHSQARSRTIRLWIGTIPG